MISAQRITQPKYIKVEHHRLIFPGLVPLNFPSLSYFSVISLRLYPYFITPTMRSPAIVAFFFVLASSTLALPSGDREVEARHDDHE